MNCPFCDFNNIEGVDTCEQCGQALTAWDASAVRGDLAKSVARTPVSKVQARAAIRVTPQTTVGEVVDRLVAGDVGCVLVVDDDRLLGIFSERDLLMKVALRFEEVSSSPIREFMTPDPESLGPDATLAVALNRMDVGGFRHLPIVEDGRPIGVVSVRDLLNFLADHYPKTAV